MSEEPYEPTPPWRPERPCRPEVEAVVAEIRAALTAQGLTYEAEQDDVENPDYWVFTARDASGRLNLGMIGWSDEGGGKVGFVAYDPVRANHDEREGVPEDESRCFWRPSDWRMLVMHLNGEVHEVMARHRVEMLAALAREDDAAA